MAFDWQNGKCVVCKFNNTDTARQDSNSVTFWHFACNHQEVNPLKWRIAEGIVLPSPYQQTPEFEPKGIKLTLSSEEKSVMLKAINESIRRVQSLYTNSLAHGLIGRSGKYFDAHQVLIKNLEELSLKIERAR